LVIDNNAVDNSEAMKLNVDSWIASGIRIFQSAATFIGNRLVDNGNNRTVVNGVSQVDNGAIDGGFDEVVFADKDGYVVDRVKFNTNDCPAVQGFSLERRESLGASDCSNFGPSKATGGTPGRQNDPWTETFCDCSLPPPPRPTLDNVTFTEIKFSPDESEWVEILNNGK